MPKIPDARQRGDASRSRFLLVGDASTRRSPSRARGLISRAHSQRPVLHEERRYWVDSSPRQPVGIAPPPPAGGLRRRVNASLPRATTGGDGGREAHNPRGGPAERWPRQGRSVSRGNPDALSDRGLLAQPSLRFLGRRIGRSAPTSSQQPEPPDQPGRPTERGTRHEKTNAPPTRGCCVPDEGPDPATEKGSCPRRNGREQPPDNANEAAGSGRAHRRACIAARGTCATRASAKARAMIALWNGRSPIPTSTAKSRIVIPIVWPTKVGMFAFPDRHAARA